MPDKIEILHSAVSQDYDIGTLEEFSAKLQDPEKQKAFFEGVGSEYNLGTFSEFQTKVSVKKKEDFSQGVPTPLQEGGEIGLQWSQDKEAVPLADVGVTSLDTQGVPTETDLILQRPIFPDQPPVEMTVGDYIKSRDIWPSQIDELRGEDALGRVIRAREIQRLDEKLGRQEERESSYFFGTATAVSMGAESFVRTLQNVSTTLSDWTGIPDGGEFGRIADWMHETLVKGKKKTPEGLVGDVLWEAGQMTGLFMELAITPEFKFGKVAVGTKALLSAPKSVPKIVTQLTVSNFANTYGEMTRESVNAQDKWLESLKAAGHGAKDGIMLSMLGYGSGYASGITKQLGGGQALQTMTRVSAMSTGFGGLNAAQQWSETGTIDMDQVKANIALGALLSVPEISNMVYGRAMGNYITSSPMSRKVAKESNKTPEQSRVKSTELTLQAEKETDITKKDQLLTEARVVDNLADIKIISKQVEVNPGEMENAIKEADMDPAIKESILDKLDQIKVESDPVMKQANKTSREITDLEMKKTETKINKSIPKEVKDAKVESLDEQIEEKRIKLKDSFKPEEGKPSEKKEKPAEKPKEEPAEKTRKPQFARPLTESETDVAKRGEGVNQLYVIEDAMMPRERKGKNIGSQFEVAIKRKEMTYDEAVKAIESIGAKVPEEILGLKEESVEKEIPKTEKTKESAPEKGVGSEVEFEFIGEKLKGTIENETGDIYKIIEPDGTVHRVEKDKVTFKGESPKKEVPKVEKPKEPEFEIATPQSLTKEIDAIKEGASSVKNVEGLRTKIRKADIGEVSKSGLEKRLDEVEEIRMKKIRGDEGVHREEVKKKLKIPKEGIIKGIIPQAKDIKKDTGGKLKASIFPVAEVYNATVGTVFKTVLKTQDFIARKGIEKIEDAISKKVKAGIASKNKAVREASKMITAWANNMPRTAAEAKSKRQMGGKLAAAEIEAEKFAEHAYDIVGRDVESVRKVWTALDPQAAKALEMKKSSYKDLNAEEKILYDLLRNTGDFIHDYHYSVLKKIDKETYEENKGKYIARAYDMYDLPKGVEEMIKDHNNVLSKQWSKRVDKKFNFDYLKARKEINDFKKEHMITDPVFLTSKRLRQTEQNAAIYEYSSKIAADPKLFTKDAAKAEAQGFEKMGEGYGELSEGYVAPHIVEDFKGYYYQNDMLNHLYDAAKIYDRHQFRQFLKKYHTVFSPAVQLGNASSNFVFSFLSGIDPVTYAKNLPAAYKEINTQGEIYMKLLKNGVLGSDVITADLRPLISPNKKGLADKVDKVSKEGSNRFIRTLGKVDEKITKFYGDTDAAAKISAYISLTKDYKVTEERAMKMVFDGYQNYSAVGKIWDLAAKIPFVGPPFVKFQADLQRIVKNAALKRPLSAAAFIGTLKLIGTMGSKWSNESETEKEIREERLFIPKIKLPEMIGGDVPLVFQTPYGEVNLARYISPLYAYDTGDKEHPIENWSKWLPYQIKVRGAAEKGTSSIALDPKDVLLGPWYSAFVIDRDFRGLSIQDPQATRFLPSGVTDEERMTNAINYIARSQVPMFESVQDLYLSTKYGTDFYGRRKDWKKVLISKLVKVQDFKGTDYEKTIVKEITSIEYKVNGILSQMTGSESTYYKALDKVDKLYDEGGITDTQYDNKVLQLGEDKAKREASLLEKLAKTQEELEYKAQLYENILNPSLKRFSK